MNDFNINENTINKLKDMMNNGDLSQIMSQIPPDMIKNFSSNMQNNNNSKTQNNSSNQSQNFSDNSNKFDLNNIDINTIMKIKNVMEKMNSNDDARSNLLQSLRPYLRESKKEKLDQYSNLMNVAKIAELLKNDNKESPHNG